MTRRTRRILKVAASTVTIVVIGLAAAGCMTNCTVVVYHVGVWLGSGGIAVGISVSDMGFHAYGDPNLAHTHWIPRSDSGALQVGRNRMSFFFVPGWLAVVVAAIPTFLLWRADRRLSPGHCQTCGYDLTGNESGVCPECGEEFIGRA